MPKSSSITDIGKKRIMNQDYIYASDIPVGGLPNLYIVADGMGGHQAGDYASRFTVTRLAGRLETETSGYFSTEHGKKEEILTSLNELVSSNLKEVNRQLRNIARSSQSLYGMGTTAVISVVQGSRLHAWNVGDSRLYLYRQGPTEKEGKMLQVTRDHSLVEEMIEAGTLTESGAREHPDKNVITRAVGAEDRLKVDYFSVELMKGDLILMCTDGLTNMLENQAIARIIADRTSLEAGAFELVAQANANGGRDNISVILIDPGC